MDKQIIFDNLQAKAASTAPIGGSIKFVVDGNVVHVDGTGDSNIISGEDKEADTVISTSADVLEKLGKGQLNPMMAVMSGKVKIKGNMELAMKLQSLLG